MFTDPWDQMSLEIWRSLCTVSFLPGRTMAFGSRCHAPTVYTNSSSHTCEEDYHRRASWVHGGCHGCGKHTVIHWDTSLGDVPPPSLVHLCSEVLSFTFLPSRQREAAGFVTFLRTCGNSVPFPLAFTFKNWVNGDFNWHCFLCDVKNCRLDSCFSQVLIWWRIKA